MLTRWLAVALVAVSWRAADACSCSPEHPQTHFCNSDFVIVGRVQKVYQSDKFFDTYKVKIRNVLKATQKAEIALESGRINTPSDENFCGVSLKPRETYIITGRVEQLKAHVNMCGFVRKWRDMTPRQRKGFRLLYAQGCTCKVHVSRRRSVSASSCVTGYDDCYARHGVCLHDQRHRCRWTRAPALTRCLQQQHMNGTKT